MDSNQHWTDRYHCTLCERRIHHHMGGFYSLPALILYDDPEGNEPNQEIVPLCANCAEKMDASLVAEQVL